MKEFFIFLIYLVISALIMWGLIWLIGETNAIMTVVIYLLADNYMTKVKEKTE